MDIKQLMDMSKVVSISYLNFFLEVLKPIDKLK